MKATSSGLPHLLLFSRPLCLALALLAVLLVFPASARASRTRPATVVAVVKSIDRKTKTLTLQPVTPGAAFSVRWDWQTLFLAQGAKTSADALKEGTKAEVKYHAPIFGAKYATDVRWQ